MRLVSSPKIGPTRLTSCMWVRGLGQGSVHGPELSSGPVRVPSRDAELLRVPARHPEFGAPTGVPTATLVPKATPTEKRKPLISKDFRHAPPGTRTPNLLIKS
jgi:hypothetical protein